MTRRTFLGTVGTTLVGCGRAGASTSRSVSSDGAVWDAARNVVRSGALGTIVWGQITVPRGLGSGARELEDLLSAMDVRERPRRVTKLTPGTPAPSAGATTIVEFVSHPPVYVAWGPRLASTIRGTRATLHVAGNGMRVLS